MKARLSDNLMGNIEKKNYLQIINYFEANTVLKNKQIYSELIAKLNTWDKALMRHSRFDYVGNIHLKKFKPYFDEINLAFLDEIACMNIPKYDFFLSNSSLEKYGMIGSIFYSTKYWKILYFCEDTLCQLVVCPDQKLLEIWIMKSIIDGEVNNDIAQVNTTVVQERLIKFLKSNSWCQHFFIGYNRPVILQSNT